MVSKWLSTRLWCGELPSYSLLSQQEVAVEQQISELYFHSSKFADLRAQIRLRLNDLPKSAQRGRPATYWATLDLFDEYLPLVLAIPRHHASVHSNRTTVPITFPPLFHGSGALNLEINANRFAGEDQRAQFCVHVEVALVLFAMGQVHVMHAESQIEQGCQFSSVASLSAMQHAEMSWQSAESCFRWTASHAREVVASLQPEDTKTVLSFFNTIAVYATIISYMCTIHRISTHLSTLSLVEKSGENLSRLASVCARRAHTLVSEAASLVTSLKESRFSQQVMWCLSAYGVRWKAIYFQCEMQIYHLDANLEIATYFCDGVLNLRLPPLPPSSPQQDACFMQVAHEVRLLHHAHQNEAIDTKKTLLHACRVKFGVAWSFRAPDKRVMEELLAVREVGPVFDGEKTTGNAILEDEERKYMSPLFKGVIAANANEVLTAERGIPLEFTILKSIEHFNSTSSEQSIQDYNTLPTATVDKDPREMPQALDSSSENPEEAESPTRPATLALSDLERRPSNASLQNTGWVTVNYKGKLLHFEKTAENCGGPQQNFTSKSNEGEYLNSTTSRQPKLRPSSSSGYRSSKLTAIAKDSDVIVIDNQLVNTKANAPSRAPCALCERRFKRSNLPGVVVMKRIFDTRRKWGVVIQDSQKFSAPSAIYGTASVCLMCWEILTFDEGKTLQPFPNSKSAPGQELPNNDVLALNLKVGDTGRIEDKIAEVTKMIHDSIMCQWHQQPSSNRVDDNRLHDIASNKRARQSSIVFGMKAHNALNPDPNRSAHTKEEFQPWWEIDLANYVEVHSVRVFLHDEISHLYVAARGLAESASRQTPGVYPLHISISMKTGVGRDCDNVIAGCASSLCVRERISSPIDWVAPRNSRGRFVRIQCEGRAILHIERVHVYIAKPRRRLSVVTDPVARRQIMRQKLHRAAFCASVLATAAGPAVGSPIEANISTQIVIKATSKNKSDKNQIVQSSAHDDSNPASTQFFDAEGAEKKRISRLYARFKSLLDSRVKYLAPEDEKSKGVEDDESPAHVTE